MPSSAEENLPHAPALKTDLSLDDNCGFLVYTCITPPNASLPYITEPGPKTNSILSSDDGSSVIIFCK